MINNNWIFGTKCELNFSSFPQQLTTSKIDTNEGCASISDRNGNLLLYTDGVNIWDGLGYLKWKDLQGDPSSTQSAIIVPDPGNSDQYYILTTGGATGDFQPINPVKHFNGVLINVSTNSWVITPLTNLQSFIFPTTKGLVPAEKLTAIPDKNCKDFWVVTIVKKGTHPTVTGEGIFRIFKIDSSGIRHEKDIPMGADSNGNEIQIHDWGYLKASSDMQSIAIATGDCKSVLVYPFNNNTGDVITNGHRRIESKEPTYGVEFSPNNQLLYYTTFPVNTNKGHVFQVDLTDAASSPASVFSIPKKETFPIGALQLGIDKRIYFARGAERYLGAILNPDVLGQGCSVDKEFIEFKEDSICRIGLPNLLPNACKDDAGDCGCNGCNNDAKKQNEELIERAKGKYNTLSSDEVCGEPFDENCESAMIEGKRLTPCFYFHWGDGANDQIEEHDTEVFYLTVCNKYNDIGYRGLKITKVSLVPDIHPLEKIHIVPDRFVSMDCLKPCSCQTREFAIINRANDTAGKYSLEVEWCYEEIVFVSSNEKGVAKFDVMITED